MEWLIFLTFLTKLPLKFPTPQGGVVMFCPCLFCPSDNFETCLALPACWRPSVRALSFWYLFCDPRRWDNGRKLCAPRRVSASGAPHVVTWTKQTWIKHQCTIWVNQTTWALLILCIHFPFPPLYIPSPLSYQVKEEEEREEEGAVPHV